MPLYGGIDLHANNSVVVLLNEQDQVIYQGSLPSFRPAHGTDNRELRLSIDLRRIPR